MSSGKTIEASTQVTPDMGARISELETSLAVLDSAVARMDEARKRLAEGIVEVHELPDLARECVMAAGRTRALVDALAEAEPPKSRSEFDAFIAELRARGNRLVELARRRLLAIADLLRRARAMHPVSRIEVKQNTLRSAAVEELAATAALDAPPLLPGPDDPYLTLRWAAGLSPADLHSQFESVEAQLPTFIEFLDAVQPDTVIIDLRPEAASPAAGYTSIGGGEEGVVERIQPHELINGSYGAVPAAVHIEEPPAPVLDTPAVLKVRMPDADARVPESSTSALAVPSDAVGVTVTSLTARDWPAAPAVASAPSAPDQQSATSLLEAASVVAIVDSARGGNEGSATVVSSSTPVSTGHDESNDGATTMKTITDIVAVEPLEKPQSLIVGTGLRARLQPEGFTKWSSERWINLQGAVEIAPWSAPDAFANQLAEAIPSCLTPHRLGYAWIFARAIEELGVAPPLSPALLLDVGRVLANPGSLSVGLDVERVARLVQSNPSSDDAFKLDLVLAALRPASWGILKPDDIDVILEVAQLPGPLTKVLRELLDRGLSESDPVAILRAALDTRPPPTVDELRAALATARVRFHDEIQAQWSACRGRVQQTHCREAWSEWVVLAKPVLQPLYPDPAHRIGWKVDEFPTALERLKADAREVFDRGEAKLSARKIMDRTVEELCALAAQVNDAASTLLRAQNAHGPQRTLDSGVLEALRHIRSDQILEEEHGPSTALALALVRAALNVTPVECFQITGGEVVSLPDWAELLLEAVAEALASGASADRPLGSLLDVSEPLRAAAVALEACGSRGMAGTVPKDGSFGDLLRKALATRRDLAAKVGLRLPPEDPLFTKREFEAVIEGLHGQVGRVRAAIMDLDTLAAPDVRVFFDLVREADQLLRDETKAVQDAPLLRAWLDSVGRCVTDAGEHHTKALVESASPAIRERVKSALSDKRLADAVMLTQETRAAVASTSRETAYRGKARERIQDPRVHLAALRSENRTKGLVNAWLEGLGGKVHQGERHLRTTFVEFLLPEVKQLDARSEATEYTIAVSSLRRHMAQRGLNPTFLPQLAKFQDIVVLTPPVPTTARDFAQKTADAVSRRPNAMVFVLAPGLAPEPRDGLCDELRERGLRGCVVDDLDLCRLIGPDGDARPNGAVALMELFLEQQRWRDVSPFDSGEGQHVLMEMFVGRSAEAHALATSVQYSRVFSGRKLGKSALLRFVEETRDNKPLPSGSTLRVVYIPAVGVEDELKLVDDIERRLEERLRHRVAGLRSDLTAGDRLERIISDYLKGHPNESLLLVLDEADTFVDSQVDAYHKSDNPEGCLSFVMRSRLESKKDANGHPRVRFVFVGYRSTHSGNGAWANWGEVLRLSPLEPDDAIRLIEGPLARIGIDARMVAPMAAWRCGYQPAVLLAFGRHLLDYLAGSRGSFRRDDVTVDERDVAAVFANSAVQNEIRQVVRNNFQGQREAGVVFAALLQELADCALGEALDDAPTRIVERLLRVDSNLDWLRADTESARTEVARLLREFVDRQLLVDVGSQAVPLYRLRYPHHLAALKPREQEGFIREEIREIRTMPRRSRGRGPYSLFSRAKVEQFQFALSTAAKDGARACVATSPWREGLAHRHHGLAARLGLAASAVILPSHFAAHASDRALVISDATPDVAGQLLLKRPLDLPPPLLLGGVDLLRWALRRERSNPSDMVESAAIGRLTRSGLVWWFERVRGFEFESNRTIDDFVSATSGIPSLVAVLDEAVVKRHGVGGNVPESTGVEASQIVSRALPQIAQSLLQGPPSQRLVPREIEILRMAATAVRVTSAPVKLSEDLCGWDVLYEGQPGQVVTDADGDALVVLEGLGFLPVDPDQPSGMPSARLGRLEPSDALLRLVTELDASERTA